MAYRLKGGNCARCCDCSAGCLCDTPLFFVCTQEVPRLDCGPDYTFACSSWRVGIFWDEPPAELWALVDTSLNINSDPTEYLMYEFWWAPAFSDDPGTAEADECEQFLSTEQYTNCDTECATSAVALIYGEDNATHCPFDPFDPDVPFGPNLHRTWADCGNASDSFALNHCAGSIPTLICKIFAVNTITDVNRAEVHRCHYCFTTVNDDDETVSVQDCKTDCCGTPPERVQIYQGEDLVADLGYGSAAGTGLGDCALCGGYGTGDWQDCGGIYRFKISLCYTPYPGPGAWGLYIEVQLVVGGVVIDQFDCGDAKPAIDGSDPTGEYLAGTGCPCFETDSIWTVVAVPP